MKWTIFLPLLHEVDSQLDHNVWPQSSNAPSGFSDPKSVTIFNKNEKHCLSSKNVWKRYIWFYLLWSIWVVCQTLWSIWASVTFLQESKISSTTKFDKMLRQIDHQDYDGSSGNFNFLLKKYLSFECQKQSTKEKKQVYLVCFVLSLPLFVKLCIFFFFECQKVLGPRESWHQMLWSITPSTSRHGGEFFFSFLPGGIEVKGMEVEVDSQVDHHWIWSID